MNSESARPMTREDAIRLAGLRGCCEDNESLGFQAFLAINEVSAELARAVRKFGAFHSGHEGYAVILEELDELWDEVKAKQQNVAMMRAEAAQVAAMALRFMIDLCRLEGIGIRSASKPAMLFSAACEAGSHEECRDLLCKCPCAHRGRPQANG